MPLLAGRISKFIEKCQKTAMLVQHMDTKSIKKAHRLANFSQKFGEEVSKIRVIRGSCLNHVYWEPGEEGGVVLSLRAGTAVRPGEQIKFEKDRIIVQSRCEEGSIITFYERASPEWWAQKAF